MFGFTIVRTSYIKALEKFSRDSSQITKQSKITHNLINEQEKLLYAGKITGSEFSIACEKIINDNLSEIQSNRSESHD